MLTALILMPLIGALMIILVRPTRDDDDAFKADEARYIALFTTCITFIFSTDRCGPASTPLPPISSSSRSMNGSRA